MYTISLFANAAWIFFFTRAPKNKIVCSRLKLLAVHKQEEKMRRHSVAYQLPPPQDKYLINLFAENYYVFLLSQKRKETLYIEYGRTFLVHYGKKYNFFSRLPFKCKIIKSVFCYSFVFFLFYFSAMLPDRLNENEGDTKNLIIWAVNLLL